MSSAIESLRRGDLSRALDELKADVRRDPASTKHRVFLFQLLAVAGDWERARTQLDTIASIDDGALMMVQMYRTALDCERFRGQVFAGQQSPFLVGEPEPWMALMIEALRHEAEGRQDRADDLRSRALDEAPATPGTLNDGPIEWIADADSRLGPILELILNGRYYWAPFSRITRLRIEPPADLRDTIWAPAQVTWSNGGEQVALVPARYVGSETDEDNAVRLARLTRWEEVSDACFIGRGQRMLATDAGEHPVLEVRELVLQTADGGDGAVAVGSPDAERGHG